MNVKMETFAEGLNRLVKYHGNKVALIDEKSMISLTYKNIEHKIDQCISYLIDKGLKKGGTFQAILPNSIEMIILFLSAAKGGFKFAPCGDDLTDQEILTYNKITNAKLVIHSDKNNLSNIFSKDVKIHAINLNSKFDWLQGIKNNLKATDGNLYIMTSGTTGNPKAIVLSLNKLWASTNYFNKNYSSINHESVFWNYLPMSYLGGLFNLTFIPLSAGAKILVSDAFETSTSFKFWQIVKKFRINILWLVPSLIRVLQKLSYRNTVSDNKKFGKNIKMALLGTAPISLEEKINFERIFGFKIYENYGLSETNFISVEIDSFKKYRTEGSVGSVLPYVDINLKNNSYKSKEISIKSPFLFLGYLEKNGRINSKLKHNKFFATGDIGEIIKNNLVLKGRSREIIKKGGYLIQLREIEEVFKSIKEVNEIVAVPFEDDFYGENYVIFCEGSYNPFLLDKINSLLKNAFSIRKHPKNIFWVDEIPKTRSGKIRKNELKKFLPAYFSQPEIKHKKPLSISKKVIKTKPALSIEINQLVYNMRRAGEKIVALSLGEAFFEIPQYSFSRLDFQKGYHYSDTAGSPELRKIISQYYQDKYNAPVFKNEIIVSAGSKPLVYMVLSSILNEGEEVLVHEPAWLSYNEHISLTGAKTKYIPFSTEVKNFKKYFNKNTKLIIINNPNNPRGKIYNEDELRLIYKFARENGSYVLVDEAYSDFVTDNFISMANIVPNKEGIIIVNSLSKNLGISGWRIGYVISSHDIREQVLKLNQHIITCAPTILCMYVEKYHHKMIEHTSRQISKLLVKRESVKKYMDKINIHYLSGSATFYFFVSIEDFPGTDNDFSNLLLIKNKIAVVPGSAYGKSTKRYVRLSIGTENIKTIYASLNKIKKTINISKFDRNALLKKIKEWNY